MNTQTELIPRAADQAALSSNRFALGESPQERITEAGALAMSDVELLALVLGGTTPAILDTARALLNDAGSLATLARWSPVEFIGRPGIGRARACALAAVLEMGRRIVQSDGLHAAPVMNRPELIAAHFAPQVVGLEVERFWVLVLNRKNRLIKQCTVTSGTATSSLAHPREVFREVIRHGGTAVVCVHNHPSGDPAPSAADVQVTRQLREAARAVDIDLLDHVIIGRAPVDPQGRGFYSFREAGLL